MTTKLPNSKKFTQSSLFPIIILFVLGAFLYGILFTNVQTEQFDIKALQLSKETIRAAKTVEDPVKTVQEKERAADEVEPVYVFDEDIASNQSAYLRSLFEYVQDAKVSTEFGTENEKLEFLMSNVNKLDENPISSGLTKEDLQQLLELSESELITMKNEFSDMVYAALDQPLMESDSFDTEKELVDSVKAKNEFSSSLESTLSKLIEGSIIPTENFDEEQTKANKQAAIDKVEPTKILQGQVLVQEGELIDRETYRQLELLGMLTNQVSMKPYIGLGLFVLLLISFMYMQYVVMPEENYRNRNLFISAIVLLIGVGLMKLLSVLSHNFDVRVAFLFPTALVPMLLLHLLSDKFAILMTILSAAAAGIIFQESYASILQMDIALYLLFGGIASMYWSLKKGTSSTILRTSMVVTIVNIVFVTFYLLMSSSSFGWSEWAFYLVAAIASGFLSGALTIGLLPFFETVFGILSPMKLIELSNPNHPLLKKILVETPGTYHHSVMVANLADAACEAVSANGLLARVGAYYHDIGKTIRPRFFIENQMGELNPHDAISPEKSRDIILAHAVDGAKILTKHKMPDEIIAIANEHHGTSLLKYFFHKAKEEGKDVSEAEFRYDGPRPKTREAAIVMVADSVEAAVRSMKSPSPEKIEGLVQKIVQDKLQDGQFDDCPLTLSEIHTVERVICETLHGIFHSRIEYPK
ncbi:HD family phosphohydrolase [Paenisporosarcina cavernae]|uniref:HDIG domain-containing protein n=1 Tax=Paenisporosarcina cavernae TaxID=2320858 RepID=A0A385YSW0_9BACL|nr:HD family phosphohydrolase [Paenisporosarcina cavernae]AYC29614.1 HDIG domain-containing protein [Paenisporosarcina cavernae]